MFEFILPDLGEGVHEGQIVNVLVSEGQEIGENDPILEVETDKAAVEIPSPKAGKVNKINVEAGQTVKVGEVMLSIDTGDGGEAPAEKPAAKQEKPAKAEKPAPARQAATQESPAPQAAAAGGGGTAQAAPPVARSNGPIPAAPVVRKLAREMGIDINLVPGSGPNGRVLRTDVESFAKGGGSAAAGGGTMALPAAEALPSFDQHGPVRREQPSQIRKTIARQMTKAWLSVPRVTHCDSADVTELEQNRKALNKNLREGQSKLTITAIVLKAVAAGLRDYPMLNCSYDAATEEVVYKDYVHLGIAVDTPRGLVVPVMRDVDKKSLPTVAAELNDIAERARESKFDIADLRGATFTITNVGALGGQFVTPMVNYPEVGILGLGRSSWEAKVLPDMSIAPRMMLPLSLSFDHRICDGADAARFTRDIVESLQNPLRLITLG